MTPSLTRVGTRASPILVIDDFTGDPAGVVAIAAGLGPFRAARASYYPGLRRTLAAGDGDAWGYVERSVRAVAPFVGRAFGHAEFDLLEASFSLVTSRPDTLSPLQRIPHFDSADPGALLHSGIIPATATFSPDPRAGRLTANFFLRQAGQR